MLFIVRNFLTLSIFFMIYNVIFISFCSILYRQILGIPMCAYCAHFVAVGFVMRETSFYLYLTTLKLELLKHSSQIKISR